MDQNRREFLKAAGVSAFLLGCGSPFLMLAPGAFRKGPSALGGKRWAMTVDLQACNACGVCTDICHAVHNVPPLIQESAPPIPPDHLPRIPDPRHEVKWIWLERFPEVFPDQAEGLPPSPQRSQRLPVLCNHCVNPSCVQVCPTKATFKREDGIVMMDEHRCIGCRYCMTACPYGSRSFNFVDPRPFIPKTDPDFPTRTKGVVENCNFCEERLADGRIPACVEACAGLAAERKVTPPLLFGDLSDSSSGVFKAVQNRHVLRRKAELGNEPNVFYLL